MRDETIQARSALEEISRAATPDEESEPYQISIGASSSGTDDIVGEFDELIEQVIEALPTDDVQFDESMVKENLEEILLMLISLHGETHGKQLLSDLSHLFGAQLSPGTVYPSLHGMEEEEVLSMHAKVRTKEYSIADEAVARASIERTMLQHLAFGMLLYAFLPRL